MTCRMRTRVWTASAAVVAGWILAGCYEEKPATPQPRTPAAETAEEKKPAAPARPATPPAAEPVTPASTKPAATQPGAENRVTMETNFGTIVIELDPEKAPITVKNFLAYVDDKHYDGTLFHRVIPNFMIQGGGFEPGMKEKPTKPGIQNEAKNGLKNLRGTVAMARTNAPHSATSQFFINVQDNAFLDYPGRDGWGYCVFGKVVEGMDVVDKIKVVPTKSVGMHQNVPQVDVIIKSIRRM